MQRNYTLLGVLFFFFSHLFALKRLLNCQNIIYCTSYDQWLALQQFFSHFGASTYRQTRKHAKFKNTTVTVSQNV